MNKFFILFIALFLLTMAKTNQSWAQTIPVDNIQQDDIDRINQLKGDSDIRSFTIRPINSNYPITDPGFTATPTQPFQFLGIKGKLQLLPFDWVQQYNSHHPYGWNDGAMIPAKGYQTLVSTGFYFRWGIISLQLKPEMVYAANNNFSAFAPNSDTLWAYMYSFINRIDNPEKFGNDTYKKIYSGQSNLLLNFKSISAGISTENIWWGPGYRNSLLMSNSAPGFLHLTIHTNKPIKTGIGNFEFELIGGKLESSGISPPDTSKTFYGNIHTTGGATSFYNGQRLYEPKLKDWRYINGLIITWQPKWIKGLYLGVDRVFYEYNSKLSGSFTTKYLPVFKGLNIAKNYSSQVTLNESDELIAFFARWLLPKAHTEFYVEWGRNDNSANLRDFVTSPDHSEAIVAGIRKLIPIDEKSVIDIQTEIAQIGYSKSYLTLRPQEGWYAHYQVRDGYTNQGQMMGAGIGVGAESEMLNISLLNGEKKWGVLLERYVHNNDFYRLISTYTNFKGTPWIDYSIIGHISFPYKQWYFNGELGIINSNNYEWANFSSFNNNPITSTLNVHAKLSLRYYW